jgi:hypothetical protein
VIKTKYHGWQNWTQIENSTYFRSAIRKTAVGEGFLNLIL